MNIFLKKAYLWLKKYWYIPLIIIVAIVSSLVAGGKSKTLKEILDAALKSFEKEKVEIEKIEKKEKEEKAKVQKQYEETVASLEEKYAKEHKEIKKEELARIKELTKKYKNNKEELDTFLQNEFGLVKK
jgi:hypothetical protein